MTIEETIRVLSHERACVMRQTGPGCDRNCAACDLVLPDELVISAYRKAVNILRAQQGAEKSEPCEFCRPENPEPMEMDELEAKITQVTPFPAINLDTGEQTQKVDPPYYAIMVTGIDNGIEEFVPIRYCPKCGRRLISTRTYESLVAGRERL